MTPMYAMGMLVCILFCGLTIDVSRMELVKVQMQNASDAAAIGAEVQAEMGKSGSSNWPNNTTWAAAGQADAASNGFTNGVNNTAVTIVQNPGSGPYAGRYDAIQATITTHFQPIFMGLLNSNTWSLSTQSVALLPPCEYFIGGASSSYTYTFANASAALTSSCPVYANGSIVVDGFSKYWGFGLDVAGALSSSILQGWTSQQSEMGYGGNPPSQSPSFNVASMSDPLLSYVPSQPSFNGTCNAISFTLALGTATLSPGNYCGTLVTPGITVLNATLNLNPGLYIITGGMNLTNATINGTGVTLFFTKGNGANYGQVVSTSVLLSTQLNLSAPLTSSAGGIPGILFFADRNWTSTSFADFNLNSYGTFNGDGIWYLPNTGLYIWQNNFNIPNYGGFVARNIYFFGTSIGAGQDYSWLSGGSPFRTKAVLVQ